MRISDWSSDVCSSDLLHRRRLRRRGATRGMAGGLRRAPSPRWRRADDRRAGHGAGPGWRRAGSAAGLDAGGRDAAADPARAVRLAAGDPARGAVGGGPDSLLLPHLELAVGLELFRSSEEHTFEL